MATLAFFLAMLALTFTTAGAGGLPQGDVCRISDPKQGGCKIDGSGCDGEQATFLVAVRVNQPRQVVFAPYNLTISKWDETALNYTLLGNVMSHAIVGEADTWQVRPPAPSLPLLRSITRLSFCVVCRCTCTDHG